MNATSNVVTWLAVVGIGFAVVAGGFLGVRTARQGSEAGVAELVIVDPELFSGPPAGAFTSPGGFSGFGAAALRGEVLGSGALVSVEIEDGSGTILIRNGSRELAVRFLSTLRLYHLVSVDQLAVGDTVVVRSVDGVATSLLRVPVDADDEATP